MSHWLAVLRVGFEADTEVEAQLVANEMVEALNEHVLQDDDTCDATQVLSASDQAAPTEIIEQLRHSCDLLIKTKIKDCWDLARELHKVAWILEHRDEDGFQLVNYDYGSFIDRCNELLGRKA